jgi:putative ABC transport system permease protein
VEPLVEKVSGDVRKPLLALMCAVGILMLIACVNVSNILLARGVARRKEISISAALGAGRRRIVQQLLIESLLLAAVSNAVGMLVALAGLHLYGQLWTIRVDAWR